MPEMLMGFPSQSFLPGLKALIPLGLSAPLRFHFLIYHLFREETCDKASKLHFEAFILKAKQFIREGF
jgi:hypothetical protein